MHDSGLLLSQSTEDLHLEQIQVNTTLLIHVIYLICLLQYLQAKRVQLIVSNMLQVSIRHQATTDEQLSSVVSVATKHGTKSTNSSR